MIKLREGEIDMISFAGRFDGKVIKPDEDVEIPVNTPLRVTIETTARQESNGVQWESILELARQCAIEGPEDLAANHLRHT